MMMKKLPFRERGALWFAWRKKNTVVTGSALGAILGVSPYMSRWKYFELRTGRTSWKERERKLSHPQTQVRIQHGNRFEDRAIREYERYMGCRVERPGLCLSPDNSKIAATPDGYVPETKTVVEIKCPYQKIHNWPPPPTYIAQTLVEAHVTGAERIHLVSFLIDPDTQQWEMNIMKYAMPEDLWYNEIIPEIEDFIARVEGRIPPPPTRCSGMKKKWTRILQEGVIFRGSHRVKSNSNNNNNGR